LAIVDEQWMELIRTATTGQGDPGIFLFLIESPLDEKLWCFRLKKMNDNKNLRWAVD
jgi:hypothetical protein